MPRRACTRGTTVRARRCCCWRAAGGPGGGRGVVLRRVDNMPLEARDYASLLYATLHSLDEQGYDWIGVEPVPTEPAWAGIADRLRRAAARE